MNWNEKISAALKAVGAEEVERDEFGVDTLGLVFKDGLDIVEALAFHGIHAQILNADEWDEDAPDKQFATIKVLDAFVPTTWAAVSSTGASLVEVQAVGEGMAKTLAYDILVRPEFASVYRDAWIAYDCKVKNRGIA